MIYALLFCHSNSLEINKRAEFQYKKEKEEKRNAREDIMDKTAGIYTSFISPYQHEVMILQLILYNVHYRGGHGFDSLIRQ